MPFSNLMTITRTDLTIKCRKVFNILDEVVVMQTQVKVITEDTLVEATLWMGVSLHSPVTICNLEDGNADDGGKSPYNTSKSSIPEGGARGGAGARGGSGSGDSGRATRNSASICGGERVSMCRTRR